jgi:hypothetical protein
MVQISCLKQPYQYLVNPTLASPVLNVQNLHALHKQGALLFHDLNISM